MRTLLVIICGVLCCGKNSGAITLDALMERTLAHNPEIQKAKYDLERAAGMRLVFRSVALPDAIIGVAGGLQGGQRAGEKPVQPFGFGYGGLIQPLFNAAIPASLRRGDVEILIAQQQLNVAVVQQLHTARIAFYTAIYNHGLEKLRDEQRNRLQENAGGQKNRYEAGLAERSAFLGAEVQTRELDARVAAAERAYRGALLKLTEAVGDDSAQIDAEGNLHYAKVDVDLARSAAEASAHRPDLKLARLLVRAAHEDQRMIEAAYYPALNAVIAGDYIPVSGVRRQQSEGSPKRSDDIISSESRTGGAYTWRVIDNGKVGGAVAKQRAAREINELVLQKMERDVSRDLARIKNDLDAIAANERALQMASTAATENAERLQQNLTGGVSSQLEFRLGQNDLLETRTALLSLAYKQHVDLAEWDRATGRYLQFLDEPGQNVQ